MNPSRVIARFKMICLIEASISGYFSELYARPDPTHNSLRKNKFVNDRSVIYLCIVNSPDMGKAEDTRQMIIERSAPIFNKKGIAATAMSDIMEATNLSKGSLYVHFENKDILAATVVDYNMELLSKRVLSALNRLDNPKDKLFAYIDLFKNPHNPPIAGGCPMMNFGVEADDLNETVRQKVARNVEASQQLIAGIIKQGISQGIFKPDWNYKEFGTLMFAMIEGGVLISRTTQKGDKMNVINRNLKKMIEDQLT